MKKRGLIYVILAGILWATSGVFFNLLKPYGFSPLHMTAMRGVVAAIFMAFYVLFRDRELYRITFKEFIIFALGGLSVFGVAVCYYAAIDLSSVSTAVILMYTAPVFVTVYSVLFMGEKLSVKKSAAIVIIIAGCALVSGVIGGMKFSPMGILMGLLAGICYSAYNIFTKIGMMQKSNPLSSALYCFIVMGIASLLFCHVPEALPLIAVSPVKIILLILGIGIMTCFLPYILYTAALKDIPAGTASSLSIIEPMAATVFSVAFFGEKITLASFLGIVLILTAVFMLSRNGE